MSEIHLFKKQYFGIVKNQCGYEVDCTETNLYETIDYKPVTCDHCKRSTRYKELEELDKTMSEIKTEAEIDFKETKQETSTTDKIESVLSHLDGKLNSKQYVHVFNTLKSFDDGYAFDCANSFHRAITGEFIND